MCSSLITCRKRSGAAGIEAMKGCFLTTALLAISLCSLLSRPAYAQATIYDYCPPGFTVRNMIERRDEMASLAEMYRKSGMGNEYTLARQQITSIDNQIYQAHLNQWVNNISLVGDPSCAVMIFNMRSSFQIDAIKNGNLWDISVNNVVTQRGLNSNQLIQILRSP
jgi:hypothetical protein